MTGKLLPLGTIVYLKEGNTKIMVVGRGASFSDEEGQKYSDYIGVIYPNGIDPEDALFFNHADIDEVIFEGYSDEEEERYVKVFDEWKKGMDQKQNQNQDQDQDELQGFNF